MFGMLNLAVGWTLGKPSNYDSMQATSARMRIGSRQAQQMRGQRGVAKRQRRGLFSYSLSGRCADASLGLSLRSPPPPPSPSPAKGPRAAPSPGSPAARAGARLRSALAGSLPARPNAVA